MSAAPAIIVFDLDFTLWDAGGMWCDCLRPPFSHTPHGPVDADGRRVRLYEAVPEILDWCENHEITMAVASRTGAPDWARQLLDMLEIRDRFAFEEIYPSSKLRHFESLRRDSGVSYSDMLFFDDEMRNVTEVATLGVTTIHVPNGLTQQVFDAGLDTWASGYMEEIQ